MQWNKHYLLHLLHHFRIFTFLRLFHVSAPLISLNMGFKRLDNIYFSFLSILLKFLQSEVNNSQWKICNYALGFPTSEGLVPQLNNVTFIAHGLHRVCESIRENYNSVNDFIAAQKKIFVKAPSRQVVYKEVTGLHRPQFPVITSRGTWIRCAVFLWENFDKIKCRRLNRCSSHQAGSTISQQQSQCMVTSTCLMWFRVWKKIWRRRNSGRSWLVLEIALMDLLPI